MTTALAPAGTVVPRVPRIAVPLEIPPPAPAPTWSLISLVSANEKTGPIPTVSRPQTTCPSDCPLLGSGCYAENPGRGGRPSVFAMVDRNEKRIEVRDIARLAPGWQPAIRFNVAGDYLRPDGTPDTDYIADTNFVATARRWVAISYTHAWRRLKPEWFRYVVRASVQTREEAEEAHRAGWWTAIVDPGPDDPDTLIGSTIDGRRVVQCPATNGRVDSCASCRLCGRKAAVIAFPVHGARRKRARDAVSRLRKARATGSTGHAGTTATPSRLS